MIFAAFAVPGRRNVDSHPYELFSKLWAPLGYTLYCGTKYFRVPNSDPNIGVLYGGDVAGSTKFEITAVDECEAGKSLQ